jgi:hypothetical protein
MGKAKHDATHCAVSFLCCEAMIFAHCDSPLNVTLLLFHGLSLLS